MASELNSDLSQADERGLKASLEAVRRDIDDDDAWMRLSRILASDAVGNEARERARHEISRLSPTGSRRLWQHDCLNGVDSAAAFVQITADNRARAGRPHYHKILRAIHRARRPAVYLEIGVRRGNSLRLATESALRIGVDPEAQVPPDIAADSELFSMTSDEFFADPRLTAVLEGRPIDLTFIDGMHLFEFALRDFINAETHSGKGSAIVLHDCLPKNATTAARERTTTFWTGDVWKPVHCLIDERPDLGVTLIDCEPSGLCLVEKLQPGSGTLSTRYRSILETYLPLPFEAWTNRWPKVATLLRTSDEAIGT